MKKILKDNKITLKKYAKIYPIKFMNSRRKSNKRNFNLNN